MTVKGRALFLGAAILAGLTGGVGAAEDKATATKPPAQGAGQTGPATGSVGAGGLTGSAATKDGARTGTAMPSRAPGTSAPGTAR